jgi:hypothetical protein
MYYYCHIYGVTMSEREEEMTRWYFYRQEIGYAYGSTKSYEVFLLGSMFSQ